MTRYRTGNVEFDTDGTKTGPRTLEATAESDPIAAALEAGLGEDVQARRQITPPEKPWVPPSERGRRRGTVIPQDFAEKLYGVVEPWHAVVAPDDVAMIEAHDALLSALGAAEESAERVRGIPSAKAAEERAAVDKAAQAAKAGAAKAPKTTRTDWDAERAFTETQFKTRLAMAREASATYARAASQIDPALVLTAARAVATRKAALHDRAASLASEVDALMGEEHAISSAAHALHIGPRWFVGAASERSVDRHSALDDVVAWTTQSGDVIARLTDEGKTLPVETRRYILDTFGHAGLDFVARLEVSEDFEVTSLTRDFAHMYERSTLTTEERAALARREFPPL